MRTLCLQFQPKLAPLLSQAAVSTLMLRIALANPRVRYFSLRLGGKRDPYINYLFTAPSLGALWQSLRKRALQSSRLGPALRRSTIVTMQGPHGWDDYLLLHHFDPMQPLDTPRGTRRSRGRRP
jgi:hypothetical protein